MIASHEALDEASRQLMMDIGPIWGRDIQKHRDLVLAAYGPALERAPKARVLVTRDIAYGAHARQVLDLFLPIGVTNAPVAVFVHGGTFCAATGA